MKNPNQQINSADLRAYIGNRIRSNNRYIKNHPNTISADYFRGENTSLRDLAAYFNLGEIDVEEK